MHRPVHQYGRLVSSDPLSSHHLLSVGTEPSHPHSGGSLAKLNWENRHEFNTHQHTRSLVPLMQSGVKSELEIRTDGERSFLVCFTPCDPFPASPSSPALRLRTEVTDCFCSQAVVEAAVQQISVLAWSTLLLPPLPECCGRPMKAAVPGSGGLADFSAC